MACIDAGPNKMLEEIQVQTCIQSYIVIQRQGFVNSRSNGSKYIYISVYINVMTN